MAWEDRQGVYNFNPGPAALPEAVLRRAQEELPSYAGGGLSVLEMSHRSQAYDEIQARAQNGLRRLLGIPDTHRVLFLQGGASLQFAMVPLNFIPEGGAAGYVLTGSWSEKAYQEAERVGLRAAVAASTKEAGYRRIPDWSEVRDEPDWAYVHITTNNTIVGSQWHHLHPSLSVPLVADMSSDICSRPVRVEDYHLIYAGAQKNIGPAGVTVVIVREDWLGQAEEIAKARRLPTMLRYAVHAKNDSRYNTPPVFAVYLVALVAEWTLEQGGLSAMEARNREKADLIYGALDESDGFYQGVVEPGSRSWMNATFRIADPDVEKRFLEEARAKGFLGLAGHRSVGGVRVSMYNAVPVEACAKLREFMDDFRRRHR
ncbi:3-phosphoserine/phosphohydroxythreonine transaminase [Alicyclobacillus sp.]|uniref:3-phosphoserine/phosphohydroxythreonine transaminase n=1 Tax=Alicyclobacillus sp. TaxID=61169 RepID=UPI0025B8415A|nr:3-phosphoserine/phosphohydroxythreonine transaminase [Alicyclobacillus sp.]MCL6515904.1 3-phosphoserine/phosphohydroxythreonine transaminase [Alicyclobacillus sp.]